MTVFSTPENRCVCCGEMIPEGIQVCYKCSGKATEQKENLSEISIQALAEKVADMYDMRVNAVERLNPNEYEVVLFKPLNPLTSLTRRINCTVKRLDTMFNLMIGVAVEMDAFILDEDNGKVYDLQLEDRTHRFTFISYTTKN